MKRTRTTGGSSSKKRGSMHVKSTAKQAAESVPLLPSLNAMPLHLASLDQSVSSALLRADTASQRAEVGFLREAEAARESTFSFLESNDEAQRAAHTAAYSAASLLVARAQLLKAGSSLEEDEKVSCAKAALRALDLAMLRGGYIDWAPIAAPLVTLATHMKSKNTFTKRSMLEAARNQIQTPHNAVLPQQYLHDASARSIPRIDARDISVESFTREYMEANPPRPVILIHALDAWPASALWKSLDYLHETAGDRLVPVETCSAEDAGRSFLSHTWSHRIMSFSDYIQRYVVRDPVTVALDEDESQAHGYLAQHPLLDQVPALREDIIVPVFCRAHTAEDNARPVDCDFRSEPLVSAWFGPKDTVSPIHNDPYHNTLAQIVGSKYVRIYETSVTDRLYPTKSRLGHNSQVDLDDVDELHFPLFKGTPCWQAVLQAGELLYIPRLNWHYVRSLEMSISASFWFGAKMELIEGKEKGTYGVEYVRKHDPGKSLMIQ